MKVNQAEIVISAVSEKQYPQEQYPEFALAGRSNVGKSSLINRLINRKKFSKNFFQTRQNTNIKFLSD